MTILISNHRSLHQPHASNLATFSVIFYMYECMYVAPPVRMGMWSMARVLWRRIEYYYYFYCRFRSIVWWVWKIAIQISMLTLVEPQSGIIFSRYVYNTLWYIYIWEITCILYMYPVRACTYIHVLLPFVSSREMQQCFPWNFMVLICAWLLEDYICETCMCVGWKDLLLYSSDWREPSTLWTMGHVVQSEWDILWW